MLHNDWLCVNVRGYHQACFDGHPPLGVNATLILSIPSGIYPAGFQWAPTLGGECYRLLRENQRVLGDASFNGHPPLGVNATDSRGAALALGGGEFQWAPTLGGECYIVGAARATRWYEQRFNGHPPLGVNATSTIVIFVCVACAVGFNGHPPLGVNATCRLLRWD